MENEAATKSYLAIRGVGLLFTVACVGCGISFADFHPHPDIPPDQDDYPYQDYYPYQDDYPYQDYYPYSSGLIDPLGAGVRVTVVQAKLSESEPSAGRSVALILQVRDAVARTRGVADVADVRWNEALLRGAAGSLATTWSVQLVAQGADGDILIDECRFRVTPEMIREWGGLERVHCGGTSDLVFQFDHVNRRFL